MPGEVREGREGREVREPHEVRDTRDTRDGGGRRETNREPKPHRAAQPGTGEYLAAHHLHKSFREVGMNNDPRIPAARHLYYQPRYAGPTRNALPPGVKPQKCRFWPHCIKDDCNFVHPTRLCEHFPSCRHGDACLFIHPACSFGPNCSRRDCKFSHSHFSRPPPIPSRRALMAQAGYQHNGYQQGNHRPQHSFNRPKDHLKESQEHLEDRRANKFVYVKEGREKEGREGRKKEEKSEKKRESKEETKKTKSTPPPSDNDNDDDSD